MSDLKIFTENIEELAINQIDELLSQDAFKDCKIRIMPDVHSGKGCVIGFTGNLGKKVIPSIVGVDIGCGMFCANVGTVNIDLEKLDQVIRKYIPSGMNVNKEKQADFNLKDLYMYNELNDYEWIENSIGSLGGGNHFIEIDRDEYDNKYLVIHTGSRNLGVQVAKYYQDIADKICNYNLLKYNNTVKETIQKYKESGRQKEIQSKLEEIKKEFQRNRNAIPYDLAYLEDEYRDKYLHDMKVCQEFAVLNRLTIAKNIAKYMNLNIDDYFESVHNYISFEDNVVRKGAISARKNQKVIIPINMRDGCIIGLGKGNNDWNNSAPHGAGRIMSRSKAKELIEMEEYKNSMKDIYTTSVNESTIDEAPFAYKPMDEILEKIEPTVKVTNIIKPIYNFKASE